MTAAEGGEGTAPEYPHFKGEHVRDRLLAALRFDLLGPETEDEVLAQSPNTRYLVGMLAPGGTSVDSTEDESLGAVADDGQGEDAGPALSNALDASAIGVSFVVPEGVADLQVTAAWGEYEKAEKDEPASPPEASRSIDREDDPDETASARRAEYEWRRTQQSRTVHLSVKETDSSEQESLDGGIRVEWIAHRSGDRLVVSVFLVNGRTPPDDRRPPDEMWIYQPSIRVTGDGNPFLARQVDRGEPDSDPDVASSDLIYRGRREFATGHGIAASWTEAQDPPGVAEEVHTEVIPDQLVSSLEPAAGGEFGLDMDDLATATSSEIPTLLGPLLDAYEGWISDREEEAATIGGSDRQVAVEHLALAGDALERMRAGMRLLETDADALAAFQFANQAMAEQRRRSVTVLRKRRGEAVPESIEAAWRPFQIGFILLCIPGIASQRHPERDIADLLWFPTGGGKTEAYLGLTAFTLALRRLREDTLDAPRGTAVLMRYTLRLLTIQQFQRALTLICACELIREADTSRWGEDRFTIGLWVGQGATPNNYDDSKDALERLVAGERVYDRSPYQVLFCPWCAHDLEPSDYACDDDLERTLVKCPNAACDFSAARSRLGLPLLLVDEEIYRNPPGLLIATVDKFAQMAWNGRVQSLFGRVSRHCPRHGFISSGEDHPNSHRETPGYPAVSVAEVETMLAPPDLIIQDELHLISGPLGTLVGIYETAVDGLCAREIEGERVRPKVIASTATIRRALPQIERLFQRHTKVFPPLGLDAGSSFFAREVQSTAHPGRLYVGIYAPGRSVKTALVRIYAALLARARLEHQESPSDEADSYMTLVGYFNSLRELGGAVRLVEDDVPARLRVLNKRGFSPNRTLYEHTELTSRVLSSQIPGVLQRLERTFASPESGAYPIDVLLASNMISVGVDIDRLGLMVVSGQPKTSAEYIQATSRVGRVHPGLIIEVYNWSRPRDTSHYERFRNYHETFYRHVEATSVTPFSARARDRALAGVLTSYVRLDDPAMSHEQDAEHLDPSAESPTRILEEIALRALNATGREDVRVETEQQVRNLVAEWSQLAEQDGELVYTGRGRRAEDGSIVLLRPMELGGGRGVWPTAGSLREVEVEVDVVLGEDV